MGSSDGVPAANQRTPPASRSLGDKDNGSGGKFLPLNCLVGVKADMEEM